MNGRRYCRAPAWLALVCTHNPCYVISALLVMYGLHLSFAGRLDPAKGWLLMKMLMGYTALLAGAAAAIIRFGRVWEDARTLVLLVLLMFVALSSSFDRVCLDDSNLGGSFLATGFIYSIFLCELLVRGLKVRLPWTFRGPLYVHLAILFAYPAWLGRLSLTDREPLMAWYVLGYTTFNAAATLLLLPAVRQRGRNVIDNGTPWSWPWYPLTLHALLAASGLVRGFAMSLSFSESKGFVSGLLSYVLIPVALAWLLLWVEAEDLGRTVWRRWAPVVAALATLALALPGESLTPAQGVYVDMLQRSLGSPIQIAAVLLVAYFAYLWRRGLETAEWGLAVALVVLTCADQSTVSLRSLAPIQLAPALTLLALLLASGLWRGSASRVGLAMLLIAVGFAVQRPNSFLMASRGYGLIHTTFVATMLIGLIFNDRFARLIAAAAPMAILGVALLAVLVYRFLFPDVPTVAHALLTLSLGGLAGCYWRLDRRLADLQAMLVCVGASLALGAEYATEGLMSRVMLRGKAWLLWGIAFLAAGFVVSLVKGGQLRRLRRVLLRLNRAVHRLNESG